MTSASALREDLRDGLTLNRDSSGLLCLPPSGERGMMFGGRMLSQAIVAASDLMPEKKVKSIQTVFARGVSVAKTTDVRVERIHEGRNLGSASVHFDQDGTRCASALVLLDGGESDLVRYQLPMPEVESPDPMRAAPRAIAAPETIIVGDVDVNDPDQTGPAALQLWVRFADLPNDPTSARALLAHATDGWLIATAMRPHPGLGQALAHVEVSTGVLTQNLSFHTDFDTNDWLFIDHQVQATGGGRTYGQGHVFSEDGRLVASFTQDALLRRFPGCAKGAF